MGDMEIVRQFNSELSTIYETKPPISKAKVASVTRLAVKAIKYYKHVVQSIEKFAQKCRQEYKIPALYVIDSIIRQSRHQFGSEKDVYGPRFAKNIKPTFQNIFRCTVEEQGKVIKVLNLWQKNGIYPPEIIQPLLNLPATLEAGDMPSAVETIQESSMPEMPESQTVLPTNDADNPLASALEEQRQEHMQQIQLLQQQLQEQQRINEQQQQQLRQQHLMPSGMPPMQPGAPVMQQGVPGVPQGLAGIPQTLQEPQPGYDTGSEGAMSAAGEPQGSGVPPPVMEQQPPKFQLQPEVYAQIQALTGMNIRIPQVNQSAVPDSSSGPSHVPENNGADASQSNQMPGFPNSANFGAPPGMPVWAPHGVDPVQQGLPDNQERRPSLIDDFDYGDDDDDASRIAEQRRHLMEEERRLSQEIHPHMGEMQGEFENTFRPVGDHPDRHPDPAGPFGRRSPERRSPGGRYHRSRSPRRRSRSPRWRDRSPRRRSRSPYGRERDRDRDRDRGRNRERDREWHKERDYDRDREKERGRGSDREAEKQSDWIPVPKKETLSVCSTTIWVGHLGKSVMKENLQEMFEAHRLTVLSIDMVPPRGCAYVVMGNRQEASRVLVVLKNARIYNYQIKLAWAPGKGVKGREYKEYFDTEQGVAFIPWSKLGSTVDLQALSEGGWIDPETLPPGQQNTLNEGSETGSTDTSTTKDDKDLGTMSQEDLMKLAAAQASNEGKGTEPSPAVNPLGQPPPRIPPPGPHVFPGHHPMIPPPMMIQPPFPGAPMPPNMVPPGAPPPNMAGVPPPNMGGPPLHQFNPPGPPPVNAPRGPPGPPPNLGRPQEGGQFPPENSRFPPPGMPQDAGQFPPQFPGRLQEGSQFPTPEEKFPPHHPGRQEEGTGQFPPHHNNEDSQFPPHHQGRPQDAGQFPPPHHPGRPQEAGQFPPHHPGRPQDGGPFPPHHFGRFPDGHFPPMHHGPPSFHQRPPHRMRMPPFHPGGPRFPHDVPPLMPSGGPPRGPDFGPPGPWGPGPGPMRGPPPHGLPPPGWPDTRPPEDARDSESAEEWNEQPNNEGEDHSEQANTTNENNPTDKPDDERDLNRRSRREHEDQDRERPQDRSRERGRDRDDRGRDRDDRLRGRDRDDRFRDRDRGWDRERDRDRGRDRDRDRDDRRRERGEYRSNRDFNGERDVPRDGPRRRSRFEPLEPKPDSTESDVKVNHANEIKETFGNVTNTVPQNVENELTPSEEGEIVDGNDEGINNPNDNETVNIPQSNEEGSVPKIFETVSIPKDNQDSDIPTDNKAENIPRDIEAKNIPTDINAEGNPMDFESINNPTDMEAAHIPKDIECVDFPKENEAANAVNDSEQSSAVDTSKLLNPEIKEDGEIEQNS